MQVQQRERPTIPHKLKETVSHGPVIKFQDVIICLCVRDTAVPQNTRTSHLLSVKKI